MIMRPPFEVQLYAIGCGGIVAGGGVGMESCRSPGVQELALFQVHTVRRGHPGHDICEESRMGKTKSLWDLSSSDRLHREK
jgi:hypothetical protein